MKSASIVVGDSFFMNNRLFDISDTVANRDNCLYPFYLLRKAFKLKDIELSTSDVNFPEEADLVIYNEMPMVLPHDNDYHKSYLVLFESELIRPDNWDLRKHQAFKKIFTWNDDFVDNEKYFKINFSALFPRTISKDLSSKVKLCTLIAGNKKVCHPLELYSKRVEVIRWFEKEHPHDFDLYGVGWNEHLFTGSKLIRALNRIKPLTKLFAPGYPSYKGSVKDKISTLESYKFSICFENARDIPGYITEKIFDCFFAGCIPIYWGANNVAEHIPAECYIDMRNFPDIGSMYDFLTSMSNEDYLNRLNEIDKFIHSEKSYPFSIDYFVKTIVEQVTNK